MISNPQINISILIAAALLLNGWSFKLIKTHSDDIPTWRQALYSDRCNGRKQTIIMRNWRNSGQIPSQQGFTKTGIVSYEQISSTTNKTELWECNWTLKKLPPLYH